MPNLLTDRNHFVGDDTPRTATRLGQPRRARLAITCLLAAIGIAVLAVFSTSSGTTEVLDTTSTAPSTTDCDLPVELAWAEGTSQAALCEPAS